MAPRDAKRAGKGAPGTAELPAQGVSRISVCFFLPRLHPGLQLQIPRLSVPRDERNILFLLDFPTQAGFLEGEGWDKVKTRLCNKCGFHLAAFYLSLLGILSSSPCV